MQNNPPPPDKLNSIGVLTRREVEARLLAPLLEALGQEFDRERVLEIIRQTIIRIAQEQGAQMAQAMGGNDLACLAASMEAWKKDDAMQMEVVEHTREKLFFNVRRCQYAEMYTRLGIPELGATLSCNRDHALIQGLNPAVRLQRTQTIMEGAEYCDFRYVLEE